MSGSVNVELAVKYEIIKRIIYTIRKCLGTNSTRFHVEITIINFIYYYYLTIGGLGFGVWGFES